MSDKIYITQRGFRKDFNLLDDYKIPQETIDKYVEMVENSWNAYQDLKRLNRKKFKLDVDGKNIEFIIYFCERGWGTWLDSYEARKMYFEIKYCDPNRNDSTPFWTNTMFDNPKHVAHIAYNHFFNNHMAKLISKWMVKGIGISYSSGLGDRTHPLMEPIKMEGVNFTEDLYVVNPEGNNEMLYNVISAMKDGEISSRIIDNMKD